MTTQKHTPLHAKEYDTYDAGRRASIYTPDGIRLAMNLSPDCAAFIVLAVNSHERLMEAAKAVEWLGPTSHCPWCSGTRRLGHQPDCHLAAAIALAEGRTDATH